jgi:hypothetical protein
VLQFSQHFRKVGDMGYPPIVLNTVLDHGDSPGSTDFSVWIEGVINFLNQNNRWVNGMIKEVQIECDRRQWGIRSRKSPPLKRTSITLTQSEPEAKVVLTFDQGDSSIFISTDSKVSGESISPRGRTKPLKVASGLEIAVVRLFDWLYEDAHHQHARTLEKLGWNRSKLLPPSEARVA